MKLKGYDGIQYILLLLCLTVSILVLPGFGVWSAELAAATPGERFIDNDDGTVTDQQTGLMWFKNGRPTFGAMTWEETYAYCSNLKFASYDDWYLPSRKDWASIIDTRNENPALVQPNPFENIVTYLNYWARDDSKLSRLHGYTLNLYRGKTGLSKKTIPAFPWPVRRAIALADNRTDILPAVRDGMFLKDQLKSRHIVLRFRDANDLDTLDWKLQLSPAVAGVRYLQAINRSQKVQQRLGNKLDALFERVQVLLDMRKPMDKIIVEIYSDRDELKAADKAGILKESSKETGFYDNERRVIGINLDSVTTQVLGYHIALAVIDSNVSVRQPRKVTNIMAMYVDQSLR